MGWSNEQPLGLQAIALELQTQSKLHLAWWRRCIDDAKAAWIGDVRCSPVSSRARQGEVHVVEDVERVRPELQADSLRQREVFARPISTLK
jgi:hypothetical protein